MYGSGTHDLNVNQPVKITNIFATWDPEWSACVAHARVGRFVFRPAAELQANLRPVDPDFPQSYRSAAINISFWVNYGQVALFLKVDDPYDF